MLRTIATVALVMWLAAPSLAAIQFSVILDGTQAGTGSGATGSGSLDLVDIGGGNFRLDYTLNISADLDWSGVAGVASNGANSSVTGFHIHNNDRGANGGVVYGLYAPSHDFRGAGAELNPDNTITIGGSWGPSDGNPGGNLNGYAATGFPVGAMTPLLDLNAGEDAPLYFNVHTNLFGGGEIRGQIVAVPEPAVGLLVAFGFVGVVLIQRRTRISRMSRLPKSGC